MEFSHSVTLSNGSVFVNLSTHVGESLQMKREIAGKMFVFLVNTSDVCAGRITEWLSFNNIPLPQ